MNEEEYTKITYDLTMHFAGRLVDHHPSMIFCYVSGNHTDSSEKGGIMWARVKGMTENALMELPFKKVYNFRPGFMKPVDGQKNIKGYYKIISTLYPLLRLIFPKQVSTLNMVGIAMINSVLRGYSKKILKYPTLSFWHSINSLLTVEGHSQSEFLWPNNWINKMLIKSCY